MTGPVTSISEALELLAPPFEPENGDWDEIVRQAAPATTQRDVSGVPAAARMRGRRFLIPAIAFVVAAVVVASTLAATGTNPFSAFTHWLSGEPGRPAPPAAQRQFKNSPGQQSWDAFPTGTKLRMLVRGEAGGRRYVLYGFRSGNSLCLTLDEGNRGYSYRPGCAAASTLSQLNSPVVPIGTGRAGASGGSAGPPPEVSVGIVADGVSAVSVNATDGTHRAWVGGDAYLWVEDQPNTGNQVLSFTARSHGQQTTVPAPIAPGSFGPVAPPPPARGPSRLQATITHPTIGWLDRHQPVGIAASELKIAPVIRRLIAASGFTRFIRPDPLSNALVGVSARRLFYNGSLWGGSNAPYFNQGPIHIFYPPDQSSQQFVTLTGVAADGVTEIKIFLGDGQVQPATLKDNVFTALIPRSPPARIVAYNSRGLIVGIETIKYLSLLTQPALRLAATHGLKPVLTVHGPDGATATLSLGATVNDVRCWQATFSDGQTQSGCERKTPIGAHLKGTRGPIFGVAAIYPLGAVQPVGRDLFILAQTQPPISEARLEFSNGDTISRRPVDGYVIFAVPRSHLSTTQQHALLRAYDSHGQEITRVTYQDGHQTGTTPLILKVLPHIKNKQVRARVRREFERSQRPSVYFRANP